MKDLSKYDDTVAQIKKIDGVDSISNHRELAKNRTTITIAHRLSTIRNADEILVVADNGIAERVVHAYNTGVFC